MIASGEGESRYFSARYKYIPDYYYEVARNSSSTKIFHSSLSGDGGHVFSSCVFSTWQFLHSVCRFLMSQGAPPRSTASNQHGQSCRDLRTGAQFRSGAKLRHQLAPSTLRPGRRAPVLPGRLGNVAGPAQALQPVGVVGVLRPVALKRHDVVALESPGPAAHDAPPPVALEDGPADGSPALAMQRDMVVAHDSCTNSTLKVLNKTNAVKNVTPKTNVQSDTFSTRL